MGMLLSWCSRIWPRRILTSKQGTFTPKKWTENDVDIEISHCGICGSDMHTLKSVCSLCLPNPLARSPLLAIFTS